MYHSWCCAPEKEYTARAKKSTDSEKKKKTIVQVSIRLYSRRWGEEKRNKIYHKKENGISIGKIGHRFVGLTNAHFHLNQPVSFSLPSFIPSRRAGPVGLVVVAAGLPSVHAEPPPPLNPPVAAGWLDPPGHNCIRSEASCAAFRISDSRPPGAADVVGVARGHHAHCDHHMRQRSSVRN